MRKGIIGARGQEPETAGIATLRRIMSVYQETDDVIRPRRGLPAAAAAAAVAMIHVRRGRMLVAPTLALAGRR